MAGFPRTVVPHRRPEAPVLDLGRLLIGLLVIAVGGLYLLEAADVLDAGDVIHDWWPAAIVAAGVLTLAERPPSYTRGAILTVGGVVGLLFTTDVLDSSAWRYVWPTAIIVAGLVVVLHWSGRAIPAGAGSEDVIRTTSVFGGADLATASQSFRGAWLTAVFGGAELDLRDARPAPEGATINATAAFGGIDILVPKGWRVTVRCLPIFGGVDDKTDRSQPAPEDAPTLHVDAVCLFGGVGLKHEK